MATKIDMHLHTKGSDGWGTPTQIVKQAKAAGLDGICITDHHNTFTKEGDKVAKAAREAGLVVIRGAEYSTAWGHLLVFLPEGKAIEDYDFGFYPETQDVIDAVVEAGGAAIPAHPYKGYRRRYEDRVKQLHRTAAIETINGRVEAQSKHVNRKADAAADARGSAKTGGSDAHDPKDIGLSYTEFTGVVRSQAQFLKALKAKKFSAVANTKCIKAKNSRERIWKSAPRKSKAPKVSQPEQQSLEDFDTWLDSRSTSTPDYDPNERKIFW